MSVPGPVLTDRPQGAAVLRVHGLEVARYVWQPDLPPSTSPRPYLHPVRTLTGTVVTDAGPDSHPHQLGIGIAVPDVGGCNFWGGRTFVAGHGPAWLDNHGVQRHQRWLRQTSGELAHTLHWVDPRQAVLIRERRSITCRPLDDTAWALGIRTQLTNATERPLALRSPAADGRAGAGYGGFFWRGSAVAGPATILSPAGTDVQSVHGSPAGWLAISGTAAGAGRWSMLFLPGDDTTARDRWFVRVRDYLGVGSSLAWDRPFVLAPGETATRHVITVVADAPLSLTSAADLADTARRTV